jgi:hypothetical protein
MFGSHLSLSIITNHRCATDFATDITDCGVQLQYPVSGAIGAFANAQMRAIVVPWANWLCELSSGSEAIAVIQNVGRYAIQPFPCLCTPQYDDHISVVVMP